MVFQVIRLAEIVQTVFEGEERGIKQKAKTWDTSSQGGFKICQVPTKKTLHYTPYN